MPPQKSCNEQTFVVKKVTNRMIYEEVCSLHGRLDSFQWQLRGLWGVMGLFGAALALIAAHIIP